MLFAQRRRRVFAALTAAGFLARTCEGAYIRRAAYGAAVAEGIES
jgi:hypothetical protein